MLEELILKSSPQTKVQATPRFPECPYGLASCGKLLISCLHQYLQAPELVLASLCLLTTVYSMWQET